VKKTKIKNVEGLQSIQRTTGPIYNYNISWPQGSTGFQGGPGIVGVTAKRDAFLLKKLEKFKYNNFSSDIYFSKNLEQGRYQYSIAYELNKRVFYIYEYDSYKPMLSKISDDMFNDHFTTDLQVYRNLRINQLIN
jgi:hypothetical protein